jgi:TatD DNase family protein
MTNYTVRYIAQRRGEDLALLCRRIRENSVAVYGSWGLPGFGG